MSHAFQLPLSATHKMGNAFFTIGLWIQQVKWFPPCYIGLKIVPTS